MANQQMLLGAGGDAKTTYVEDVFKINLWTGNDTNGRTITSGLDIDTEGGMVWVKARTRSDPHIAAGTGIPDNKYITVSGSSGISGTQTTRLQEVTTTGFKIGTSDVVNQSPHTYASWSFLNSDHFLKVIEYSGNSSNPRTIAHGLGSTPGMILIVDKANGDWDVWHRDTGLKPNNPAKPNGSDWLPLEFNNSTARSYDNDSGNPHYTGNYWNFTDPDATNFTVGEKLNESGRDYLAYIFGGGESPAATARSVDFDGSNDYIQTATSDSPNISPGTGDFCIEAWVNPGDDWSDNDGIFSHTDGLKIFKKSNSDGLCLAKEGVDTALVKAKYVPDEGTWTHVAFTRSGTTLKMFLNGTEVDSATDSTDFGPSSNQLSYIGWSGGYWKGKVSNLRIVKGSAVYTSSFTPPTEPLTNISGTGLLCCNNSSATGATVGTISAVSSGVTPTATKHSPFDDPAGFAFGKDGHQIIKCGGYIGNGNNDGPQIYLGWEPQYIIIKNAADSESWHIMDCARGMPVRNGANNSGTGYEKKMWVNGGDAESDTQESISIDARGFQIVDSNNDLNGDGDGMVYIAIRRTDGYVGKPPAAASDVFKVVAGGNNTQPTFNSGFQTDCLIRKAIASGSDWVISSRLTGRNYLRTNGNDDESLFGSNADWSFENGMGAWTNDYSDNTSWNWRRHKGFDVVPYNVRSSPPSQREHIPHSLNAVPEMIWVKARTGGGSNDQWAVYHKDLSGTGGHAYNAYLYLNSANAKGDSTSFWVQAPTSTHFTVSTNNGRTGDSQHDYIAYLFASSNDADGNPISKVGTYTGNTSSQPAVELGFQPSFVLIKRASGSDDWNVYDTLRGISQSGDEKRLKLNADSQQDDQNHISLHSSGFQVESNNDAVGGNNDQYVYYAHK